jgi:hypothetical protein
MYVLKTQGEVVWSVPVTGSGACGNEPRCCKGAGIVISTFSCWLLRKDCA